MADNPFVPSSLQTLGMMLSGLGSGISAASARNLPAYYGIAPGAQAFTNSYGNLLARGANYDLQNKNYELNKSYKDIQEQALQQSIEAQKQKLGFGKQLLDALGGGGAVGMRAPQKPLLGPDFNAGPNDFNIGNVRPPGSNTGFQQPASLADGIALAQNTVKAYPGTFNNGQPMTIAQIGQHYAPSNENDTSAWVRNVATISGLDPNKPLDLTDPNTLAALTRGIHGAEKGQQALLPPQAYLPGASPTGAPSGVPQLPGPPPDTTRMQVLSSLAGYPGVGTALANRANQLYGYDKFRYQAGVEQQKLQQAINNGDVIPDGRGGWVPNPAKTAAAGAQERAKKEVDQPFDTAQQLVKGRIEDYDKNLRPKALDAVSDINDLYQMRQLLDQGIFSGPGAGVQEYASRLSQIIPGVSFGTDQQANTKAFQAFVAQRVANKIKAFGSGTGLSDADREYALQAAGGKIEIGEPAIRKLMAISERADRNLIKRHDQEAARLKGLKGADSLGPTYFDLPPTPTYDEWKKENPPIPVQGATPNPTTTPNSPPAPTPQGSMSMPRLSPEDARKLPPGTPFIGLDGKQRVRQ